MESKNWITDGKLKLIFDHYGIDAQLKKLNEEFYELIVAIVEKNQSKTHIEEELADVFVMLEQIKIHFNFKDEEIEKIMLKKIDRTIERINNE